MKAVAVVGRIFFSVLVLVVAGCEPKPPEPPSVIDGNSDLFSVYSPYTAAKLDIIPLTGFVSGGAAGEESQMKVYVSLLDSFGCEMKSPGTFRFELYECVQRSSGAMDRRIAIWHLDLTEAEENNGYWRDYLRAYEFDFDFEPQSNRNYRLHVTFMCPDDKRLSDDFIVKCPE